MSDPATLRRHMYHLMIVVATGMAIGRIFSAELLLEPSYYRKNDDPEYFGRAWPKDRPPPMPTFSSNDRSRWCTVYSLVENGTFVISRHDPKWVNKTDNKIGADPDSILKREGWGTIDIMMNPETKEFYSTKPPLLPVLVAGECLLLKELFGLNLDDHLGAVIRIVLVTFNVVPWVIYLLLLSRLIERYGTTDWGRLFAMAAACFATLMTPFLITLNNHTVGTCSVLFALWFATKVWTEETPGIWPYVLSGFFAGFAATMELPALAFVGGLGLVLLLQNWRKTLGLFAPAALVPLAALVITNYLAIGDWRPGYSKFGTEWYTGFPNSHWGKDPNPLKPGIDFAHTKETRLEYAFHVLAGHHGLFSLTPVVLLSFAGMLFWASGGRKSPEEVNENHLGGLSSPARLAAGFAFFSLVLSLIVIGFYLGRSNNYGGWTNGPRWLMWLTPCWILCLLPAADRLAQSRTGRWIAGALFLASVLSMHYQSWNPWRHPWIYNWMDAEGLIPY